MAWNYNKPIKDKDRVELELQEAFEYIREIESRIQRLAWLIDDMTIKMNIANISYGLSSGESNKDKH